MNQNHTEGVRSKAAIGGHPIHPMLIPFPIAFLVGLLVTDVVYLLTGNRFWASVSQWLVLAGLITGLLAAVFGLIDFTGIRRAREHKAGWIHAVGNVIALLLTGINLSLRVDEPGAAIWPWGITLSSLVAALLGVTGWYGGELSYHHKIGVVEDHGRQRPAPEHS